MKHKVWISIIVIALMICTICFANDYFRKDENGYSKNELKITER